MMPTVSVLIATYNGARFIKSTLESVLAQVDLPDEVIVVDDCSSDDTASLVETCFPTVKLIRLSQNGGGANAYNAAGAVARGDILAFLDHDDLWHPEYIYWQRKVMAETSKNWSASDVVVRMGDGRSGSVRHPKFESYDDFVKALLVFDNVVSTMSSLVVRKSVFELCGGLDATYKVMFDYDLYRKLGQRGQNFILRKMLCTKNQHESNLFAADGFQAWKKDATLFLDRFFAMPENQKYKVFEASSRAKVAERYEVLRRRVQPNPERSDPFSSAALSGC